MTTTTRYVVRFCILLAATLAATLGPARAARAYVTVYGTPSYTPGSGGYQDHQPPFFGATLVNDAGTAVGTMYEYDDTDEELGPRAIRWNSSLAALAILTLASAKRRRKC